MFEVNVKFINQLYHDEENLVGWFSKATPRERVLVFEVQNQLFSLSPKQVTIPQEDTKKFLDFKHNNTANFTHRCFLFGCYQTKNSKKGQTNEVKAIIQKEKEERLLEKQRSKKFRDKFRKHYFDVQNLKNNGASWTIIAKYISSHHKKYYKGYTITPSYLRRTFNELTAEFEKASTSNKL